MKINNWRLLCLTIIALGVLLFSLTVRAQTKHSDINYIDIEWTDLIPPDDLAILLDPPAFLLETDEHNDSDDIKTLQAMSLTDAASKRFLQALESTRIVETFNGKWVKIPGFIVPLATDEKQQVIQFFIVPYFGACLHMPPPPPNQIIFVNASTGIELTSLYDAFWFEGKLKIDTTDNLLGKSAYSITLHNVYPYEDE